MKALSLSSIDKKRLLDLLKLRGDISSIQQAKEVLDGSSGKKR